MQILYIILCIVGAALPLAQFIPWLSAHGIDLPLLLQQAIATPISAFAWSDVFVTGLAVMAFVVAEGRRLSMPRLWLPLLAMLVGPSLSLPLFLFMRERHISAVASKTVLRMPGTCG